MNKIQDVYQLGTVRWYNTQQSTIKNTHAETAGSAGAGGAATIKAINHLYTNSSTPTTSGNNSAGDKSNDNIQPQQMGTDGSGQSNHNNLLNCNNNNGNIVIQQQQSIVCELRPPIPSTSNLPPIPKLPEVGAGAPDIPSVLPPKIGEEEGNGIIIIIMVKVVIE